MWLYFCFIVFEIHQRKYYLVSKGSFPCLLLVYILSFFMMTSPLNHIYVGTDYVIRCEIKVPSNLRVLHFSKDI